MKRWEMKTEWNDAGGDADEGGETMSERRVVDSKETRRYMMQQLLPSGAAC